MIKGVLVGTGIALAAASPPCATLEAALQRAMRAARPAPDVSSTKASGFRPAELTKVAVLVDCDALRRNERASGARLVEDQFLPALLSKGYKIAARSDVDRVLEELRFQHSGLTERDASKLGRMLNVPAVLVVTLNELQTTRQREKTSDGGSTYVYVTRISLGARLISVEKAEILWVASSNQRFRTEPNSEHSVLAHVAGSVAEAFPSKYSDLPAVSQAGPTAENPERQRVRMVQGRLNEMGYDCGLTDGLMGRQTQACIERFQRDNGLPVTGQPDAATLGEL